MNAPVMVELEGETDPLKIAMKELKLVTLCCCSICCYMSVITVTSYWGIIGCTILGEYHWMEYFKVYVQYGMVGVCTNHLILFTLLHLKQNSC